ncbi:MAG: hypothetical protein V1875_06675 [Candidatus Altiarchaeota archaeon]
MKFHLACLLVLAVFVGGCLGDDQTPANQNGASSTTLTAHQETTTTSDGPPTTIDIEEEEIPTTTTIRIPFNMTNCQKEANATIRDACFFDAAGREKDISICAKIDSKNTRLKCQARLEDDSAYCDDVDVQVEKDFCYRMMAFKWNKLNYCKGIFYAQIRDKCVLDYVRDKKPDPYECFQIVDSAMRDECIYYHVDLYDRTGAGIKPTLCNLLNNETMELKCNETYLKGY